MFVELYEGGAINSQDIGKIIIERKGNRLSLFTVTWDWDLTFEEEKPDPNDTPVFYERSLLKVDVILLFHSTEKLYYLYDIFPDYEMAKRKAHLLIDALNKHEFKESIGKKVASEMVDNVDTKG